MNITRFVRRVRSSQALDEASPVARATVMLLRAYLRRTPFTLGRGFLAYAVMQRLLPSTPYVATMPGGGRVLLRYQEVVGLETFLLGSFEHAEMEALRRACDPRMVAIDVGANVGLFTVVFATAAREVWAYDPLPANAARVRESVALNGFSNVRVVAAAVGDTDGTVGFHVAHDDAFGSTEALMGPMATGETLTVPAVRLDSEWEVTGRPPVSVLKVDAEGAELRVLRGASGLLSTCRPLLLLEAREPALRDELARFVAPFGYVRQEAQGFQRTNYLFVRR